MPHREPRLEGERVVLRLAAADDVPTIAAFYRDNLEFLRLSGPTRPPEYYTRAYWRERIIQARDEYLQDRSCHLWVFDRRDDATLLGFVNFSNFVRGAMHGCHIGYGLAAQAEGRGLMFESIGLAIPFAFEALHMHRVMANYRPQNERSGRLLRRLGFVVEGYARDYLRIDGRWEDHIMTALLNPDWKPPGVGAATASSESGRDDEDREG